MQFGLEFIVRDGDGSAYQYPQRATDIGDLAELKDIQRSAFREPTISFIPWGASPGAIITLAREAIASVQLIPFTEEDLRLEDKEKDVRYNLG